MNRGIAAALLLATSLMATPELPARWQPLRPHVVQSQLWHSTARFRVVPAGRRSGKTELAKRRLVLCGLAGGRYFPARYFAAAPTRDQAKRIYWADLKSLVPRELMLGEPSETELKITIANGAEIWVVGLDKPQRIEGTPWDGGILDEFGNMKPTAWSENVRPALADRSGWCWLIGVPEGRNHYYDLNLKALADTSGEWASFTWPSADILPADEIESARRDLDPLVFDQEYRASFVNFVGRAYYNFDVEKHCAPLTYDPDAELVLCFDFNIAPGVAAIAQEQRLPHAAAGERRVDERSLVGTGFIGEVWIPRGSNTEMVCRRVIDEWGNHRGNVAVYADPTGGAGGTAKLAGTDLDIIERDLRRKFGERLFMRVPSRSPNPRARVNAVNSRLKNGAGEIRCMVDPNRAPHLVRDFDGVRVVEGGSGEIDKQTDKSLSHISDAAGYYIAERFPIDQRAEGLEEFVQ